MKLVPFISFVLCVQLAGCTMDQYNKLQQVGKQPPLEKVDITPEKAAQPSWPIKPVDVSVSQSGSVNSLWQQGSKSFFGDMRARNVGDILKVKISMQDKAEMNNKTERSRDSSDKMGIPSLFGLQGKLTKFLPGNQDPASLIETSGNMTSTGEGKINRRENIITQVAAVVTQVLPNGNLVIYGSQEMKVNFEVREVSIQGVVRPADIDQDNMVDMSRIAQARVNYGGRGQVTDLQQPRVGNQIVDILSPW